MIKTIWKKASCLKIRTQFALLILCALIAAFAMFEILWTSKFSVFNLLGLGGYYNTYGDDIRLSDRLYEEAPNYELPESEEDEERIKALEPLLGLADKYTSISIYGLDDGYHRTTRPADILMDQDNPFLIFLGIGDQLTAGDFEDFRYVPLKFSNGSGSALIMSYKRSVVLYPYTFISLFLSILLFFLIILFFIRRKMKSVLKLKQEILVMSSGDLSHPVPDLGGDEIGILARELDHMRTTLNDNIEKEQESRQANQDLITALSHDLRTPLTILNGYLEVIKLKKNPGLAEEYLDRCLLKTKDIKELTDRMFEYALISEEQENPELTWISTDFIRQCLRENADFIRLAGFTPKLRLDEDSVVLRSDKTMLKRILDNLFSNIFKYGDKKEKVRIFFGIQKETFTIQIKNGVKAEHSGEDKNNIGLKSARKMIRLLDGELNVSETAGLFTVKLTFGAGD